MIQQLLSRYRSFLGYTHIESKNKLLSDANNLSTDRKYGDFFLRFIVFGWFIYQTNTYHLMADRPEELFAPINWFDKLFMSSFPHWLVWYTVIGLASFLNFRLVIKGDAKWERIGLGVLILWINCIRWKYEFFSHVGHIMVLYHLLGMFLPRKDRLEDEEETLLYDKAIKWLYAGLLIGYTMSGLWKLIGLAYKSIFKPEQINWMHPLAMKLNSIVGYRDWDEPIGDLMNWYEVSWPWQIAFVGMMFLQIFSALGAMRTQLTPWIALGNIMFHLINVVLIRIEFYVAPMMLLVIFFPYHLVFKNESKSSSEKITDKGSYKRKYSNNTEDLYTGYYAFRERYFDKNRLIGGLLYLPGASLLLSLFFKGRR